MTDTTITTEPTATSDEMIAIEDYWRALPWHVRAAKSVIYVGEQVNGHLTPKAVFAEAVAIVDAYSVEHPFPYPAYVPAEVRARRPKQFSIGW